MVLFHAESLHAKKKDVATMHADSGAFITVSSFFFFFLSNSYVIHISSYATHKGTIRRIICGPLELQVHRSSNANNVCSKRTNCHLCVLMWSMILELYIVCAYMCKYIFVSRSILGSDIYSTCVGATRIFLLSLHFSHSSFKGSSIT